MTTLRTARVFRGSRTARRTAALLTVGLVTLTGCSSGSGVGTAPVPPTTPAGTSAGTSPASSPATAPAPSATSPAPYATSAGQSIEPAPTRTSTLVPWEEPRVTVGGAGPTPSASAGAADLRILLDDGFGVRAYWTLTCDPVGGAHPQPRLACGVLGARGASAFPAASGQCAEEYGGPQKVRVTGTWRGKAVDSQFTLENGCEIDRWTAMIGFLPAGGV